MGGASKEKGKRIVRESQGKKLRSIEGPFICFDLKGKKEGTWKEPGKGSL